MIAANNKRIRLQVTTDAGRSAYRVAPDTHDPVVLMIEDRIYRVINISATGISCTGPELDLQMRYRVKLLLREEDQPMTLHLDVVTQRDGAYHCRFVELSEATQEVLHQYVLQRQKQVIRQLRID